MKNTIYPIALVLMCLSSFFMEELGWLALLMTYASGVLVGYAMFNNNKTK